MKYIIKGGKKIKGSINISGNKNSVFPCIAASLLTNEEVILENVPKISDTLVIVDILKNIGAKVKMEGSILKITSPVKPNPILPDELMVKLRGSIVLAGAVLGKIGMVGFHHPGGDVIGRRSIDVHLDGFRALGVKIDQDDLNYKLKMESPKKVISIFQIISSVTATENLILTSVLYPGTVIIRNSASDPHVVDLCEMLIAMGAKIDGVGSSNLIIRGVESLSGTKYCLRSDHLEVGSFAVAAAITGGEVNMGFVKGSDFEPVLKPLSKFGLKYSEGESQIKVNSGFLQAFGKLQANIWPGFPTDMMSAGIVLATQSAGVSLCHDPIYESRMFFVDKLISMGANITIADPHRVLVYGPNRLSGRNLETPDIRAGMALVLASLVAKGTSVIEKAELIERGYEDVASKLVSLGADIERVNP